MKTIALLALTLVALIPLSGVANDALVTFEGGVGVHPVSNVAGTPNADGSFPNVTRNIWRGLLLAGGNTIGTNANASVFATLICEAAAPFVERNTNVAGVPLAPNGEFRIDDILSPAPNGCASPVLLIRSAGNRTWFADGFPKLED